MPVSDHGDVRRTLIDPIPEEDCVKVAVAKEVNEVKLVQLVVRRVRKSGATAERDRVSPKTQHLRLESVD